MLKSKNAHCIGIMLKKYHRMSLNYDWKFAVTTYIQYESWIYIKFIIIFFQKKKSKASKEEVRGWHIFLKNINQVLYGSREKDL